MKFNISAENEAITVNINDNKRLVNNIKVNIFNFDSISASIYSDMIWGKSFLYKYYSIINTKILIFCGLL